MKTPAPQGLANSRRQFLKGSGLAAGGLLLAFHLPGCGLHSTKLGLDKPEPWAPNAWLRMTADNNITVLVNQVEMGQGVYTALPMLVAEELDADWQGIQIEVAPVSPEYHHAYFGIRATGGSSSIASAWDTLRQAGAMARALMLAAAAQHWQVSAESLRTENAQVLNPDKGERLDYGALIQVAAALPSPQDVPLKDPKDFRLIGRDIKRLEGADKVTGRAEFSLDVQLPGMLVAVVAHPPVYGDKVKHYQAEQALKIPGVYKVKAITRGVAVIAKDFWTAKIARDQLTIEWQEGAARGLSTPALQRQFRVLADQPGTVAENTGDTDAALAAASQTLEAVYEMPYLAHAAMEPLNCVAQVADGHCELWVGTQAQSQDQTIAASLLNIKPEQVKVNCSLLGGGFGRRFNHSSDFVSDAVEVAKGETVPIKTIWTREQDMQGGYYRPMFTHKVQGGLNGEGLPDAWLQRLVGQSIAVGSMYEAYIKDGIDGMSVDGAGNMPYRIENRRLELHSPSLPIPVLWWRSVGSSQNAFVKECFLDELAHAGGKDPLSLRRQLLVDHPRLLKVLNLAAEKAGWGEPVPPGRGQGLAVHECFGSRVAQVAEVSVVKGQLQVHRVVCAVDCGRAVNPLTVKAQIEGGIIFGLSAALYGEITLQDGQFEQSNFHNYPVVRMSASPQVEVHIIDSAERPSGVGEPGLPPIAPAVANAVFAATGQRVRRLPLSSVLKAS